MSRNLVWLHRFAITTSVATFSLVIAGGLVTSTGSGLAVPDWPLSYGQLMPPMVGGIFYEHGHRMVATFVGMLTTILTIWLWRAEPRKWVRVLGLVALLAVITQGILGGLTVLYLLPAWISSAHATLAQSFFSLTIVISLVTSPFWKRYASSEYPAVARTRRLAMLSTAAIPTTTSPVPCSAARRRRWRTVWDPAGPAAVSTLSIRLADRARSSSR